MQNINGIFDAKIDLLDEDIIVFSAATEVRPTGLLPLVAGLSDINAQFSLVNGLWMCKMTICQNSLSPTH